MSLLIIFVLFDVAIAGFTEIPDDGLYHYQKRQEKHKLSVKKTKSNTDSRLLENLLEQDKEIYKLLQSGQDQLIVKKQHEKLGALTRLRGMLLNSVVATNLKPAKFVVRVKNSESEYENAELLCQGMSFHKRITSRCDLMVWEGREFKVDVEIWDLDGAEGIISDHFYSGEEKSFLTSSMAAFLEGVLDSARERITTPFGQITKNNPNEKALGGLLGIASNAKSRIYQSGNQNLSVSFVNSGKPVIVFFNRSVDIGEDSK